MGVLVYAFDRPGASASLLPATWSSGDAHRIFGAFGGQIPDLAHVYAFSLLTALALGASKRAALLSCALWLGIDGLFEIAQHPAVRSTLASTLPAQLQHLPIIEKVGPYVLRGTFDPWDLTALAIGAATAFLTIRSINADRRDAVVPHKQPLVSRAVMIPLVCVGLLTILGSEVGGGEDSGGGGGTFLQIFINVPAADTVVDTTSANLFGIASCPDCPPAEVAFGYCPALPPFLPDTAVTVSWANQTTGTSGTAFSGISGSCSCLFSYCAFSYSRRWSATVPLAIGANMIQVTASGALGTGSDSITITRLPHAPSNVTATAEHGRVTVAWDGVADATSYTIYWSNSRLLSTSTGTAITNVSSPYTHTGLSDDVTYYYLVTAVSGGYESFASSTAWATPGWATEPVAETLATTEQRDASIAVDSVGNAHIHYSYDDHYFNPPYSSVRMDNYYTTHAAGTWASVLVDHPVWVNANIALDSTDAVHVSYLDFPGLTHAVYGSGAWTAEVADAQAWCDASLAIDSTDKIHLAYRASSSPNDEVRYASNTSGAWASQVVDTSGSVGCAVSGNRVSIAVDAAGAAHIVYAGNSPDYGLQYATNRGGPWTVSVVNQDYVEQVSAAVDPTGTVHVVYANNVNELRYAHNAIGTWTTETIETAGSTGYPSLAVDAGGKAHVSYFSAGYGELRYAHNSSSGAWQIVAIADTGAAPPNSGSDTAIAVDSQGKVHIGYFDNRSGNLRYATNQ
jgi:hypothetical protein